MERNLNGENAGPRGDARDAALMRRLAGRYAVRGTARTGLARGELRRLETGLSGVRRLRRGTCAAGEATARLDGQRPAILALARRAASEGGGKLPAWRGRPRIEAAMEALCAGSEELTRERLLAALAELDAAQPLTQAELWAVPSALRAALARGFSRLADEVAARERRCARGRRWAEHPGRGFGGREADFIAAAIRCAGEAELPKSRRRLDECLMKRGLSPEAAVAQSQAGGAALTMRLEKLTAAARMVEALNWQRGFGEVSRVEQALRGEAAGVYPRMDDASRAAVRGAVAEIARAARLPELSVARAAVEAARTGKGIQGQVCWWLYDDEGRRALLQRLGRGKARLRRVVPDPSGRRTVGVLIALAALLSAALMACAGTPWLWAACVPLGWTAGSAIVGRFYALRFPPARLLKMEMEEIPDDCRTLVTMPVLLSSPQRAKAVCDQLEALGCLEKSENIEYLLLGDFADAGSPTIPGDGAILDAARARVAAMNARAGRAKYHLLCRERTLLKADGLWMGRDRKRGALMDLNRLLLGEAGAEAAFSAEGAACGRMAGRFAHVVTLDADTRALPGDIRRLIGAMAHPLNRPEGRRGYAVLQPRMEALPSACANGFVRLFGGLGGVNAYPISVSNLWQDLTGRGIYGGKGIYHVAAFQRRLDGALPEGRVLSHDLAEGAVAGAGFLGDVALYDGHPTTLTAAVARQHRWTRGDWQLLPVLFSRKPLPGGRRLGLADRCRMLNNLMRSLRAPALLMLLIYGAWTGSGALAAALMLNGLDALLGLGNGDGLKWRRAVAELAILPIAAWSALDAVGRTLWRLFVSGRKLLEWVTAADTEAKRDRGRVARIPGRAAALLLLPGLMSPEGPAAALSLMALFLIAPAWIEDMQGAPVGAREALTGAGRAAFLDLARRTWRFFADNVPYDETKQTGVCTLPPDNVQLDPPVGAARRTSPTNIALYLLSCLSARRLGFIGLPEMVGRMAGALDALERMEKWRGQLYNWYDIDTLAPLRPRYVSSVDSGNLAAALLLCAGAKEAGELSPRLRALAGGMDLAALYDGERELFFIGLDGETGRASASHYDLLASESRILSFAAMMLGQAPPRHWQRLGRPCAAMGGGVAPLSWSGTLFEYLMPELLLAAPPTSLLGEGVRAAVRAQMARGRALKRPWGVSESGYCALDAALNYQYRAFGLPALALDGEASEGVTAPYASMLAAALFPREAAQNLRRMEDMGWAGDWGLYEAADYQWGEGGGPALVMSHMAHHQGMILCALCNALTGDSLRSDFMNLPEARALSLLLEERPCAAKPRRREREPGRAAEHPRPRSSRRPDPNNPFPETHLLYGGGASALCAGDGAVHYWRDGVMATRFSGMLQNRRDAARTFLTDLGDGSQIPLGGPGSRIAFEPGAVRCADQLNRLKSHMEICLSPEDGTLLKVVEILNAGERAVRCAVTDAVPVALAAPADWQAHAIFQNLFVESSRPKSDMLAFERRPGSRGEDGPRLVHLALGPGEVSCETDYEKLAGRTGDAGSTRFLEPLAGTTGATLNPAGALRMELALAPGQRARVGFALCLLDRESEPEAWREDWRQPGAPERALRLSALRAGAMLDFIGLDAAAHHALQRMAALIVDGALAAQARGARRGEGPADRRALWPLGLSGDRPMFALFARGESDRETARELIRAHEFYRAAGLKIDLALIDDGGAGYAKPVRDMLDNLIASSHLNRLRGVPGGVWLLDGAQLSEDGRRALIRYASAAFDSGLDFYAQVRSLISFPPESRKTTFHPMDLGRDVRPKQARLADNGYGGFDGDGYEIDALPDRLPPAPWCNVLANDAGGMLLSERGGGFFWKGNSREGRLTPYGNDGLWEGWGLMLYLVDFRRGEFTRLLPGEKPMAAYAARHDARETAYALETRRLAARARFAMAARNPEVCIDVTLENRGLRGDSFTLVGYVEWLMGCHSSDAVALNGWGEDGACFAAGAMPGVGWLAAADPLAQPGPGRCAFLGRGDVMNPGGFDAAGGEGWTLSVPVSLPRGERRVIRLALGWSEGVESARARVREWRSLPFEAPEPTKPGLAIETPDPALNALANGFLRHQVLASRVQGRAGLYQPGGAWGFRDQLQDMLALLHDAPERARAHLLRCAARQFEAGDVLHWWHEPFTGVRTRVSDDALFLPWVAAAYVRETGDAGVLDEVVPYLEDAPLPEGREDVYAEMRPGTASDTLHGHCMRAFRRVNRRGGHGLLLMGAGDWNDGMNRVGAQGKGESVWLTQFAIACADSYRAVAPSDLDGAWLWRLCEELRQAVEKHGWDGRWYLRAYDDEGRPLGSARNSECRIDAISQAWAVLAGLDKERCRSAMDAAWARLVDRDAGLVRLLTPPFEGREGDPGYIRGYPGGVRENGGQYTHGALWLLMALIRMGDGERAHEMLRMLLPYNHSDTPEQAAVYRVEPYVMAADVYDREGMRGRGGWTWYTGSAGWMYNGLLALLGYERRGDRVRLNALLGDWPAASVTVPFGTSAYRLTCDKKTARPTLDGEAVEGEEIRMVDDGRVHEVVFPERRR